MTVRLPFTLTPAGGQGFAAWLHAYAARLDITPAELAGALGLPDHASDPATPPRDGRHAGLHVETICAATGLTAAAVQAMLDRATPAAAAPPHVIPARRRDLSVLERLRHATTLTPSARLRHATTIRQRPGIAQADPAIERASRLPDQLWPAWAIRLADDDAFDPATFRSSALAALLVPHSGRTLREIAALVSDRVQPATVAYHLRKLLQPAGNATALQILTELAFAVDTHDIPIDYTRRRHLAAASELISRDTWASLARQADVRSGGQRRARFARCYLYELLTGCNLHLAPSPYRIEDNLERTDYHNFAAGLPRALASALHQHAEELLAAAGITGEPLQWQPPASWITITRWPGADPDDTDPGLIHRALLARPAPHTHLATSLGISTGHLRYVLRQHPRPRPAYQVRRSLAPATPAAPSGHPGTIYLDPDWLRREYLTWRRSLPDIAAEVGCTIGTLKKFAHHNGIPLRRRSGPGGFARLGAPPRHPSQFPEPLRSALTGKAARQRLHRFTVLTQHPSLGKAAQALGTRQGTLSQQLAQLERACGGLLLHRQPRRRPIGPLTPLGEQLHRQTLEHLDLTPQT